MNKKTYTAEVIEENGEYMLAFPAEMIAELGWNEGDNIIWEEYKNGAYLLVRREKPDTTGES
jgi:hypothetical protein